jgi:hypothetical protein
LRNRNAVPELLLTGVSGRDVVPKLLAWQLLRDYVAVAEGVSAATLSPRCCTLRDNAAVGGRGSGVVSVKPMNLT